MSKFIEPPWPFSVRPRATAARLLGSTVRIPLMGRMFISCVFVCFVGSGQCDELITRSEKCVIRKPKKNEAPRPELGLL
jgi:hypothetical protein